jgi:hypothetical protein
MAAEVECRHRCLTPLRLVTMLSDVESTEADREAAATEAVPVQPCPVCGFDMVAIRGSKDAVCSNCGFKDSCCY